MITVPLGSAPPAPLDFRGNPAPTDRVFFLPAPPEIGPLVCAESSLKAGKGPRSIVSRLLLVLINIAVFGAGGYALAKVLDDPGAGPVVVALTGVICVIAGIIAWIKTAFVVRCAYVGERGAVRYTVKRRLGRAPRIERVHFEEAADLRTSQTRQYVNGAYTGTSYDYRWQNAQGRTLLRLSGSYRSQKGDPKPGHVFHFANAAEVAWSQFLLSRADAELAANGALRFNIDAKRWVFVSPGAIEFHFGDRVDRCEVGDIKSISLAGGTFTIHHRDAKWFSSKGKFSFPYGSMANARFFAFVLDRFLPRHLLAVPH